MRALASPDLAPGPACAPNPKRGRLWPAAMPLLLSVGAALILGRHLPRWGLMWAIAAALWLGIKWLGFVHAWQLAVRPTAGRGLGYFLGWPGTDAITFLGRNRKAARPAVGAWMGSALNLIFGVGLLFGGARAAGAISPLLSGWVGMIGLVLILHFGLFQLVTLAWRQAGVDTPSLMNSPLQATALSDFWSRRWNTGFSVPARRYLLRPLGPRIGLALFAVFFVSGLLHELVISVPAGAGFGLPTAYFLLQFLGVRFERSRAGRRLGLGLGWRGRAFVVVAAAIPVFGLFHPPFVANVIVPFLETIGAMPGGSL